MGAFVVLLHSPTRITILPELCIMQCRVLYTRPWFQMQLHSLKILQLKPSASFKEAAVQQAASFQSGETDSP